MGILVCCLFPAHGAAISESFETDPHWDAVNATPPADICVSKHPDFGLVEPGKLGGEIWRSFTPSYYAKEIPPVTLKDHLSASGTLSVPQSEGGSGALFGWFNRNSRGWRTPNSLAFRIDGESSHFRVFFEYGTQHWLTGGGETFQMPYQTNPKSLHPVGDVEHTWNFDYNPDGAGGQGEITFVFDGETFKAPLAPGHKNDGATFDLFGMFNQQIAGDAITLYVQHLVLNGEPLNMKPEDLSHAPGWIGFNNRGEITDCTVRPYHDFGWRATSKAGGSPGEIGGIVWRIESNFPEQALSYGKPLARLDMNHPLEASGRMAFTAAAADSAVLIGWYNALTPIGNPPRNFLGIMLEGPSRIGHYWRPALGVSDGQKAVQSDGPVVRPDGTPHEWTLRYDPAANDGAGKITVTIDDEAISFDVPAAMRKADAAFNRFGVLSWQMGGHYVEVYLDDLTFTGEEAKE